MLNRKPPKRKTTEEIRAAYQRQNDRKIARHKERLAEGWKPKPRNPIAKIGAEGRRKKKDKAAAIELFFSKHSTGSTYSGDKQWIYANCQLCGRDMIKGYHVIDPCHKIAAGREGGEAPENILAAHRFCHNLLDHDLPASEKQIAIESRVNVVNGGVVKWPPEIKAKFDFIKIPLA